MENKLKEELEQRAEEVSLVLAKESTAPGHESPDWMLNDIKRGYIAGATEERERIFQFLEKFSSTENFDDYYIEDIKRIYLDQL